MPYGTIRLHVGETGYLHLELKGAGVEDVDLTQAVSVEIKVIKQTKDTWPVDKVEIHPKGVVYNLKEGDLDKEGRYLLKVYVQMPNGDSFYWPDDPDNIILEVKP